MESTIQTPEILPFKLNKATFIDRNCRTWMALVTFASDVSALILALLLAISFRSVISASAFSPARYLNLLPGVLVFIVVYVAAGLYPAAGISPVEEMRRLTLMTSTTFFLLLGLVFWLQAGVTLSRLVLTLFWLLALFLVPLARWTVRRTAVRARMWGEPVAVVGCGPVTQQTLQYLRQNGQLGLSPVIQINGFNPEDSIPCDFPVLHAEDLRKSPEMLRRLAIRTAVIVPTETPLQFQSLFVDDRHFGFERLVMITTLGWVGGSAIVPFDLQGTLGLEVYRNLLNRGDQLIKRMIDLCLVFAGGAIVIPLVGLIALLIRLESKGGVFYSQKRIGQDGKEIHVWKFRTMIKDADKLLAGYLEQNSGLRNEWEATHKLKNDPRVTHVGCFLRKTSLDELPQLWNVLKGEMSLVGPRPIVRDEIKHYNQTFRLYTQVLPGITGLWQVSGRSDTSYDYRVSLDEYYIRRWSIWMDIYVLVRTLWVVLKRSGAY